jgi:carbonic anhydrase
MNKQLLHGFLYLIILSSIFSHDFNTSTCTNQNIQQSPININYKETLYSESNYFRILSNNFKPITPDIKWTYFPNELAIGIQPTSDNDDFGSMLFVKDWSIYNYILKKIYFRIGSEHSIENNIENAEMQLLLLLDNNYYSPGKRIALDSNYLIISIPYRLANDQNIKTTRLFEFMNLANFANNPLSLDTYGMNRNIKLNHIVVNQPAFMYKGTLTFPECQNALWVVFTQYHSISASDLNLLKKATNANNPLTNDRNTRDMKNRYVVTIVYRNYFDINRLVANRNLMNYNVSTFVRFDIIMIIMTLFVLLI